MDALELRTVKEAISVCGRNLSNKSFKLVFSNNQTIDFRINRPAVLSSLGFKGDLRYNPDDKRIKTMYDNLNPFERIKMIETAEAIKIVFDEGKFETLDSFVMLSYDDFDNKLDLLITTDGGENYGSLLINEINKRVEGIRLIDDALESVNGKKFVIPISMTCSLKDKVIVQEGLSKKQILKAYDVAHVIAKNYGAVFTDEQLKTRYTKEMAQQKKNRKNKKISLH